MNPNSHDHPSFSQYNYCRILSALEKGASLRSNGPENPFLEGAFLVAAGNPFGGCATVT